MTTTEQPTCHVNMQGAGAMDKATLTCDGACIEHRGRVRPVEVWAPKDLDWLYRLRKWRFNYCDVAIAEDRARGFTVKELEL